MAKTKCDKGKEYECPYQNRCNKEWTNIESDSIFNLTNSNYLYDTSKKLSKLTKIWFRYEDGGKITMYRCYPAHNKISQIFYELEKKNLISKLNKDFKDKIKNLTSSLSFKNSNLTN